LEQFTTPLKPGFTTSHKMLGIRECHSHSFDSISFGDGTREEAISAKKDLTGQVWLTCQIRHFRHSQHGHLENIFLCST
jgi:hypothetical protein